MADSTGKVTPANVQAVWASVRDRIRGDIGQSLYDTWIAPLTLESWTQDDIRIGAPKLFLRDWVANHYASRIERGFHALGIDLKSVNVILVAPKATVGSNVAREPSEPVAPATVTYLHEEASKSLWNRVLHPTQTFDSFI